MTFEEWWEENKEGWCDVMDRLPTDPKCRLIAKITWDASRREWHYG